MAGFKVVLIEHGYATTRHERELIQAAGGEFIDADMLPLDRALALCEDADAVLCRRLLVPRPLLQRFRRCRILVRYGVGTDNVDVEAATDLGIIVGHVPTYCADEVSAHAIALLLSCVRRVASCDRRMREGGWDVRRGSGRIQDSGVRIQGPPRIPTAESRFLQTVHRIAGRTLGIVGLGGIGRTVARKLSGWGLRLLAADPYVDPSIARGLGVELVDFDTLCRLSDYISLHCPLLPETRHIIDARSLAMVKPGACLVNTARGPLVAASSLLDALADGRLSAVGLDVFEEEPLPPDSPLRQHEQVVLTDHAAWYSEESQVELQRTAAEEIVRVCTGGLPRSLANPLVLQRLGRWDEWEPPEHVRWQLKRLELLRQGP